MDLTHATLFQPLVAFSIEGLEVDLHNEFDCRVIYFNKRVLSLSFMNVAKNQTVTISFEDALIYVLSVDLGRQDCTLDQFYRGRFEEQGGLLASYDKQGRSYFYLNFDRGSEIQLLARIVTASLS
jgi:hypothetical protein